MKLIDSIFAKNISNERNNSKKDDHTQDTSQLQTSSSSSPSSSPDFEYSYLITPTNFINMSPEEQQSRLGQFFDVLRIVKKPIRITMSYAMIDITIEGKPQSKPVMQVHLESDEPLGDILDQVNMEHSDSRDNIRPPKFTIEKEYLKSMKLVLEDDDKNKNDTDNENNNENNNDTQKSNSKTKQTIHASTFCLESLPAKLPYAWIAEIFTLCSHIQMWINPIENKDAKIKLNRFIHFITEDAQTSKTSKKLKEKAVATKELLEREETKMFEITLNCTVAVPFDRKNDLKKERKNFLRKTGDGKGTFHLLQANQARVFFGGFGQKLTFDLGSCSILYAFASADMLELPNGVPVGTNVFTKSPVIFDILKRTNLNIAIIGTSGSGKSFTTKIILNRLMKKFPDSYVYIIDPTNEYGSIAEFLDMKKIDITGEEELGLDPFAILKPTDAADILGTITGADDKARIQFHKYSNKAKNLNDFYQLLAKKDREYLDHLIEGPLSKIMAGPPKITKEYKKLILSLDGESTQSDSEAMIMVLLLNKIYKICNELPVRTRKIIVLDEAWRMFEMKGTAKYVNMIVRMGRKVNITFLFVSQKVDDIAKDNGAAGKIIENIATKIMLKVTKQAAENAGEVLGLSENETSQLKAFQPGNALFLADDYKITAKFEATADEFEMFDTRPRKE